MASGSDRRAAGVAWLAFAALGTAFAVVNAASEIDERARMGQPVATWEPWSWELTSLAGWLLVAPAVLWASASLRPPRLSWPIAVSAHLVLSLVVSLAHVVIMLGLRHGLYAAVGERYGGGPLPSVLVYEYRKDLVTYVALALLLPVVRRLLEGRNPPRAPAEGARIEVRDGSRTVWLAPGDVEWAQAAGNYVELHGGFGTLLHRRTLAALEAELIGHGFIRIHRSRLVRAGAVRSVENRPSGDFDVSLASGARLSGSRRFRGRLS